MSDMDWVPADCDFVEGPEREKEVTPLPSMSIAFGISEGLYDAELDDILNAARTRAAKRDEFRDYPPGTRIRLQNLRPGYLVGAEAVVIRRKVKNYVIQLDEDHGRFRAGRDFTVTPTMMKPA